jgi:UDP-glucose 4-epimerase
MPKSCIIFGGAGFIGSHIADDLLSHKIKVTIFDKLYASRKNILHIFDRINYIEGDFNNKVDIKNALRGHDYAVHLVSSTLPADSNLNPIYDVETNLISSLHFLEGCVENKLSKVIFISSGGTVYGIPESIPIKEDHGTQPTCSYGIIKLAIEKYLALYKELKGLNYTILRFSNPFGERQNPFLPQGLIVHLLYKIREKQTIEIWGDGKVVRDYFYIRDGVKSVYKAIRYNGNKSLFNISSGKGYTIIQILDMFRKVLKLDFDVKYLPGRKFDVKVNILDNKLAKRELNWGPETSFKDSLKRTWRYVCDFK